MTKDNYHNQQPVVKAKIKGVSRNCAFSERDEDELQTKNFDPNTASSTFITIIPMMSTEKHPAIVNPTTFRSRGDVVAGRALWRDQG